MTCYRKGGCGPYEMRPCNECPASRPEYAKRDDSPGKRTKTLAELIRDARNKQVAADAALAKVFETITDRANGANVDLERPTGAENAGTIEEAINCFVAYGEYDVKSLVSEIESAIKEAEA